MGELKPGWKRVKLGDVAINSTAATKDHEADGFTRYIIGKHIPEDGGRITTWNPVGDAEFGSRIRTMVRAGDVICTTRGPKLKVAVAEFDCLSAHTNFILRPKDCATFLPTILEAIVRSDGFQDHLRKHFRGSTNLFVNWSDAAQYEFALPPLEEQRRICDVLTAIETVERKIADLKQCALAARDAYTTEVFLRDKHCPPTPLSEVCDDITVGIVVKPAQWYVKESKGVPALLMKNVQRGWLDLTEVTHISFEGHQTHAKSTLRQGDVVAVRSSGSAGRTGDAAVVPASLEGANCIDLLIARPGNRLAPEYLCEYLNAPTTRGRLVASSSGTMQKHLNVGAFRLLQIPLRSMGEQERVVAEFRTLSDAVRKSDDKRSTLSPLREGAFRALIGGKA